MKLEVRKTVKLLVYLFLFVLTTFLIIFYWGSFVSFLGLALSASAPLFLGAVAAFVINILMSEYEKLFFPRSHNKYFARIRRPLCMFYAFLTAILVIVVVIMLIVPQLISCLQMVFEFFMSLPGYIQDFAEKAEKWDFVPKGLLDYLADVDWTSRITQFVDLVTTGVGGVVNTVAKTVMSVISGIITAVIGLIFSVYLLLDKDRLKRQFRRVAEAYTPPKFHTKLFYVLHIVNDCFKKFIIGQITEAIIIGVLCAFGMLVLNLPFSAMIGTLIGFTALIPIAGAYIGAITGAVVILTGTGSFIKVLIFVIFIILLQQFEGSVIYPRVVGSSIGLPGVWVLVVVTVGGGVFGIPGMLVGVPIASAFYKILKEDIAKREKKVLSENVNPGEYEIEKTDE